MLGSRVVTEGGVEGRGLTTNDGNEGPGCRLRTPKHPNHDGHT